MRNKYHIFRANHKLNMQTKFMFFDTETNIKKGYKKDIQTLKLGWVCYWDSITNTEKWKYFETSKTFWDFVESNINEELILFAHNTEFDFKIVDGYNELIIKRKWGLKTIYIEGTTFIMTLHKDNKTLRIYDTMNYVPQALEKIGKYMGLEKMEIDFDNTTKEYLKKYCKNDVKIILIFIQTLMKFLKENQLTKLKATAGSLAFNTFRHKFYKEDEPIEIHASNAAIQLERDSYRGGITDCFRVGTYDEKLYKFDVNSMYPWVMKTYASPIKLEYFNAIDSDPLELIETIKKGYHVIADVSINIKEEYAYILSTQKINKSKKSVFIKGKFQTTLTTPELEFVLKHGKILRVHRLSAYSKRNIFKKYVDFFYKMRLTYDKNHPFNALSKSFLNNLYGKFAQKRSETTLLTDTMTPEIGKYKFHEVDREYTLLVLGNRLFMNEKTDLNEYDSFVAVSSLITGYARMYLVELILKAGRKNCFYCDTDSLVVNEIGYNKLKDYIDESKLGMLKLEETSDHSTFIRPKFYDFNGSLKCKGVRKNAETILNTSDEWVIKQDQFIRYKTALSRGEVDKQEVLHIEKRINKKYDKGIVKNGFVTAYSLENIKPYKK